jgi:ribosomal protein S18 acetylase RimI-like enzyme
VVDPRFFRKGIAKRLLSHCFNLFPDQEFNVGTGAANVPAIQLYRSFNFEIMREEIVDHSLKILKLRRHSTNVEIGKT